MTIMSIDIASITTPKSFVASQLFVLRLAGRSKKESA